MKGFVRRLIDCKNYYCNISSEARWLNSKKWAVGNLFFDYKRQITVTEQSGNDLTDYQVLVELNSSNFDFSHAKSDGSDIRFHDGSNLLDYWIEKWDSSNQEAKIWVKVPSIPASSSTSFYMYYGNPDVASASNGEDTFEFFDDFEDGTIDENKWSLSASVGDWYEENGTMNHAYGNYRLEMLSSIELGISDNFVLRTRLKEDDSKDIGCAISWDGQWDSGNLNQGYLICWGDAGTKRKIIRYDNGSKNLLSAIDGNAPSQWQIVEIIRKGGLIRFYYDGTNYDEVNDATYYHNRIGLYQWGTFDHAHFDWILIRKYTDPEPSVSIGSEETP